MLSIWFKALCSLHVVPADSYGPNRKFKNEILLNWSIAVTNTVDLSINPFHLIKKAQMYKGSISFFYLPLQWYVTEENRVRCMVFQNHGDKMFQKIS